MTHDFSHYYDLIFISYLNYSFLYQCVIIVSLSMLDALGLNLIMTLKKLPISA